MSKFIWFILPICKLSYVYTHTVHRTNIVWSLHRASEIPCGLWTWAFCSTIDREQWIFLGPVGCEWIFCIQLV